MTIFKWLFGSKSAAASQEPEWQLSENGNPTIVFHGGRRLTIFDADQGWKFCWSKGDGDQDPHFSEAYETESVAKYEALAFVTGSPSCNASLAQTRRAASRDRWTVLIDEKADLLVELRKALEDPGLNVTQLRKIEAKIATQVRQLEWQMGEFHTRGVNQQAIAVAERLSREFPELALVVAQRIAERKAVTVAPSKDRSKNL